MATIGFIGLGRMGGAMAAHLVRAGHAVRGFDRAAAALRDAAGRAGLTATGSAIEAAAGAEIVVTMLPEGEHVLAVWSEVAPRLEAGGLMIDCSTTDVASARRAHAIAAAHGHAAIEAPVSGGVAGAEAGTLTFMAGGEEAAVARAEPVLAAMGRRVVRCGDAGSGQAAKICNNLILGVSMVAVAEAFALAERLGLGQAALFEVASTSSGQCWALTANCPVAGLVPTSPANRGYAPGFAAALMLKDLRLAERAAMESGAAVPTAALAAQLYVLHVAQGRGERDFSSIVDLLRGRPQDASG